MGIQGPAGEKGPTGDKGPIGDKGPVGDAGVIGGKGPVGDKGITGDKGPVGDTSTVAGPQGLIGTPTAMGVWRSTDYNYPTWTFDAFGAVGSLVITTGQLYSMRVPLRQPATITGIALYVNAVGAGLVTGQCFTCLYDANSRALLGVSADLSAAFATVGLVKAPLIGGPLNLSAGWYYISYWANGTTTPNFIRAGSQYQAAALNLPTNKFRACANGTGLTTTAPNPLPSATASTYLVWTALY